MTDPADLDRVVAEAVYGGPQPTSDRLRRWAAGHRWTTPGWVVAVPSAVSPGRLPPGGRWFASDRDIRYALLTGALPRIATWYARLPRTAGRLEAVADVDAFITAAQRSVLGLRRRQLPPSADATYADAETSTRDELVASLRQARPWRSACDAWLRMLLARHGGLLNGVRRRIVELVALVTLDRGYVPGLDYLMREGLLELHRNDDLSTYPALVRGWLERLAGLLLPDNTVEGQKMGPAVRAALDQVHAHWRDPLTVAEIAAVSGLSPSRLAHRFRSETGFTLVAYLHRIRLAHARELLRDGKKGVLQVALDCGFGSPEHFTRLFHRQEGCSPREFRRRHANSPSGATR